MLHTCSPPLTLNLALAFCVSVSHSTIFSLSTHRHDLTDFSFIFLDDSSWLPSSWRLSLSMHVFIFFFVLAILAFLFLYFFLPFCWSVFHIKKKQTLSLSLSPCCLMGGTAWSTPDSHITSSNIMAGFNWNYAAECVTTYGIFYVSLVRNFKHNEKNNSWVLKVCVVATWPSVFGVCFPVEWLKQRRSNLFEIHMALIVYLHI